MRYTPTFDFLRSVVTPLIFVLLTFTLTACSQLPTSALQNVSHNQSNNQSNNQSSSDGNNKSQQTGLQRVRFNEREQLSRDDMQFGGAPLTADLEGHVYQAREGASGVFSGSGGGGCGCY